ncbi:EamA family transporter RarD [Pseudodesulfovibrio sp. zrk46]|uniref:EamA family transporter RarD n=1 Tax=Pseudodesulfovibrio sp. zrk46 TaxID=2725288 RepID=UPI001449B313|nr:EamA family transporter RarD [Pseudodesulfovibrio sp. zrk46]QJB54998.1 EamA family transporter RarD [Pseudodesulfovibrio sp. zrk46]
MTPRPISDKTSGFLAALGAFMAWGFLPMYWKEVQSVAPLEILCHRIVWSLVFIALVLTINKRWAETFAPMRSFRNVGILVLSSLCIGTNWLLYIWAVNTNHVLESSLGYYMNPLMNVILGFIVFQERPSRMQYVAIGLAAMGVANAVISYGEVPWVSLALAISFAFYGLLRKIAAVESLPGLFLETLILAPVSLYYILHLQVEGTSGFLAGDMHVDLFLMGAGVATAMPLIGFAFGARRLQLSTLGILQYLAPSIAFLLGVFLYHEPFGSSQLITFALIWSAVAVYSAESIITIRKQRRLAGSET